MAASILDRILTERARLEGAKRALEKRKKEGQDVSTNIREANRLTTGVLTANGIHSLDDPQFLRSSKARESSKKEKRKKAASMKSAKKKKNSSGVTSMRKKYGHECTHRFFQCSANKCGAYLQYKKQGKDSGMPKALDERRLRCREWMSRPSPPPSPTHSKDEGGEQDASADVAAALLGLALNSIQFNNNVDDDEQAHHT